MALLADMKILYHLAVVPIRGETHAARLEGFYRGQAAGYDAFRQRLLPGRCELIDRINLPPDGVWMDLGGGTGANLEFAGERLSRLSRAYVVDLCPPLLDVARERVARHGWTNVMTMPGDATTFVAPVQADVVTFSYSLTMIPDWHAAIDQALGLLKPGGQIGVVDFHVSRKHPEPGRQHHGWWTRSILPLWFGRDNVWLNPDHVAYLHRRFQAVEFQEGRTSIPYLPLVRAPYYRFIGRKR